MSDVKKTDFNSTVDSGIDDNAPKRSRLKNQLLALEPRILFDGAAVATAVEVAEIVDAGQSDQPVNSEQVSDDSALLDALSGTGQEGEQRREIAFVDTSVENYQSILAAIGDNIEIVLIDSTGDGVEQIASVLSARSDIDAIHIISHGRSGTLDLGTAKLTEASMASKYADELAIIAKSLDESGDILVYGCDFGQYARGLSAVEALATATGADVAASNDLTGAENLGGDWDLEVTTGAIETQELTGGHFDGVLAPFQISVTGNPTIITLAGNDVGHHVVYENAGTVGGTPIDLHGTVSAVTGNATVIFTSAGDDPKVEVTNNGTDVRSATIVWEVFEAGTSNVAVGDVTFDIQDIDGVGGSPFTREGVEAIDATSYTVSNPTNQQVTFTGAGFESVGTQNESNGETSRVAFDWANVSSWSIKYNSYESINSHYNNDGDGDLSFTAPQTTTLVSIDADNDGVINANDLDNDNDGILDTEETGLVYTTAWLDAVGNEAVRSYATRTDLADEINVTELTNGNPLGGSGENQSTSWVTGWRIQGIMYDPGSDKFLAAWVDAFGREVINSYETQVDIGNNTNGTTISTDINVGGGTLQSQSESWTTGWRRQGIMYDPVGQKYVASWLDANAQESLAIYDTLADFANHLNPTFIETNSNPFLGAGQNQSESWLTGWRRQGITYDYETSTYVAAWLDSIGHEQVYSYASLVDMADHTNGTAIFTNGNPRGGQNENQSESWNTGWRRQGIMYDPSKIDPDGDGILNQFDLDSDNDGISDNVEAQTTAGYVALSGIDANGDGLDDAYSAGAAGTLTALQPVTAYDFESGGTSLVAGGPAITINAPVTVSAGQGVDGNSSGLLFTGTADSSVPPVSIATIPNIATTNEFSFSSQVRFDALSGAIGWERIFDFGAGENDNNIVMGRVALTNNLFFDVRSGSTVVASIHVTDALVGQLGQWNHFAGTIDSAGLTSLYINGVLVGQVTASGLPDYSTWDEHYIGASNWAGERRFQGAMDAIAIYDRALSATDVIGLASDGLNSVNTDGDLVADYIDLDSDNDGISDAVEARPTAGYASSAHVNNAINNGVNDDGLYVPVNTDGADDADYRDTDSDNDGFTDATESGLTPGADANGDGIGDGINASYADPDGDVNDPSADLANEFGDTSEVGYREALDTDGDGIADINDIDDDNDGILDTVENQFGALAYEFYDGALAGNTVDNMPTTGALSTGYVSNFDVNALQNAVDPGDGDQYSIRYTGFFNATQAGSYTFDLSSDDGSKLFIDGVEIVDNDGPATSGPGSINLSSGLHQIEILYLEVTGAVSLAVNYTPPGGSSTALPFSTLTNSDLLDTDGDGIIDSLDLDSDNDGITDNVEAQTTAGYVAPSGNDADSDGLDDAYEGAGNAGLTPVDTDGDLTADYLDLDSDDDDIADIVERGDGQAVAASGTDTDNDGLDDAFEHGSVSDGYNVDDGQITVAQGTAALEASDFDLAKDPALLDNLSNIAAGSIDMQFRDSDSDNDGILNANDIDDDNDGILDAVEDAPNGVAWVNVTGSTINSFFANGDGTFNTVSTAFTLPSSNFTGVNNGKSSFFADVNGDSIVDFVFGQDGVAGDVITVFTGNGDGSFNNTPITTSGLPGDWSGTDGGQSTFLIDVTGDGIADWVNGNDTVGGDPINVFAGNGDGTFNTTAITTNGLPGDWAGTVNVQSTFLIDVTGDGIADWVNGNDAAGGDPINVFAGNGDGTFNTTAITTTGLPGDWAGTDGTQSTFLVDVTGDGIADWVNGNDTAGGDPINVFAGNGDGTFNTTAITTTGIPGDWSGTSGGQSAFLFDVTGDGVADWVIGSDAIGGDPLDVYAGNGDGTFNTTAINTSGLPGDWSGSASGQFTTIAALGINNLDVDGDGIVNSLDLDSDNDGIADNIEAQTTAGYVAPSGVDVDNDGLDDAYSAGAAGTLTALQPVTAYDFESGGASLVAGGPVMTINAPVAVSAGEGVDGNSSGLLFTGAADSTAPSVSIASIPNVATTNEFSFSSQVRFDALDGAFGWERIFDFGAGENDNNIVMGRVALTNNLFFDVRSGSTVVASIHVTDALLGQLGQWNHFVGTIDSAGLTSLYINGVLTGQVSASGLPDYSTWDENYIGASNWVADQRFQGAMDGIAIFDRALSAAEVAGLTNGGLNPVNTDGTGPTDYLDLDSDDDGIADAVEARPTAGYVSSTHVNSATNNGVNDDGLYVPVNTDGADDADYRDTDSDNDGITDAAESGLTSGADANGDGIGDGVGASYSDPDGDVNNPSTDLANESGDTTEVGYRELLDTDGDGVADINDIDDDNDGILDSVENFDERLFLVGDDGAIYEFPTLADFAAATNGVLLGTRPNYISDRGVFTVDEKVIIVTEVGGIVEFPTFADFASETNSVLLGVRANYGDDVGIFSLGEKIYIVNDGGGIFEFPTLADFVAETNGVQLGVRPNYIADAGVFTVGEKVYIISDAGGIHEFPTLADFVAETSQTFLGTQATYGNDVGFFTFTNTTQDTDQDGIINSLDLDSDNDGITDNVETQATQSYLEPSGIGAAMIDVNNDGLDDNYDNTTAAGALSGATGVGLTPVDSDGDLTADYIDTDSDAEGGTDVQEAGHGISQAAIDASADTDGDGLKDVVDAVAGFDVNDDDIDGSDNFTLSDSDDDTAADGSDANGTTQDLDFRDNQSNTPPTIDLDDNDDNTVGTGYADTFTEGDAAIAIVDSDPLAADNENNIDTITIVVAGNSDGASEVVVIGGVSVDLSANFNQTGVTVGSSSLDIDYVTASGIFTITENASGIIAVADVSTLISGISYENTSQNPTAGNRTFAFTLTDQLAVDSNTATSTITVVAVDDAPINTVPGAQTVNEDTALAIIGISVDDADDNLATTQLSVTNGTLSVDLAGGASISAGTNSAGTLTLSGTQTQINAALATVSYQGNVDFNGADTLTVLSTDSNGTPLTDSDTVAITVTAVNDVPVAVDDAATMGEDLISSTNAASGVININDTDLDGDTLSVSAVSGGTVGVAQVLNFGDLTVNADGSWSFDPNAVANGLALGQSVSETVTYTIDDGNGGSDTADLVLTIVGSNDAVTAVDDGPVAVSEDTPSNGNVLGNDNDVDGDALLLMQFVIAGDVTVYTPGSTAIIAGVGTMMMASNGDYTFSPDTNYTGAVPVVTYTVSDGNGSLDMGDLSFAAIINSNDAPVGVANGYETALDTNVIGNALSDDTGGGIDFDIDGDALVVDASSVGTFATVQGGSITLSADGSFTYSPLSGFTGADSFIYTISDGALSATAPLTFLVNISNQAPVALNNAYVSAEDVAVTGNAISQDTGAGVDSDPDGSPLTLAAASIGTFATAQGGSITLSADGAFTYTPAADFFGTDTFDYTLSDGLASDIGTLTFAVTPVNDAPVGVDNAYVTTEDTGVSGNAVSDDTGIGADSDGEGDALSLAASSIGTFATTQGGLITLLADGSFTYAPAANFNGMDSFIYTLTDGGLNDTATLNFSVTPVNDAPVAVANGYVTGLDTAVGGNALSDDTGAGVDVDVDGPIVVLDGSSIGTFATTQGGSITLSADGAFIYTPPTGYTGVDAYVYMINDGTLSATAPLNFLVNITNTAPVASDNAYSGNEDVAVVGNAISQDTGAGVDSDVDSGTMLTLTASSIGTFATTQGGLITLAADGSFTYIPAAGFNGADSFDYTLSDGLASDTGTLNFTVTPVNDAPVAISNAYAGNEDIAINGNALGDDTGGGADFDPDGDTLVLDATSVGTFATTQGGSITLAADGSFTYTPAANFSGTDTFDYTISDGALTETASLNFTITPLNDAPMAMNDVALTDEDTALNVAAVNGVIDVNDTDVEGDTLAVTAVSSGSVGAVQTLTYGDLTLNPDGSWSFVPNGTANALAGGSSVTETVTYTIDDGNGGSDTATLMITIAGVNDAPETIGLNDVSGDDGDAVSFFIDSAFSDPDTGDVLSFSAVGLPLGLMIDSVTGEIYGTLAELASAGAPYLVTVTADDGNGGVLATSFTYNIGSLVVPAPPGSNSSTGSAGGAGNGGEGEGDGAGAAEGDDSSVAKLVDGIDSLQGGASFDFQSDGAIGTLVDWIGEQGDGWLGEFANSDFLASPNLDPNTHEFISALTDWIDRQGSGWLSEFSRSLNLRDTIGQSLSQEILFGLGSDGAQLSLNTIIIDIHIIIELDTTSANIDFLKSLKMVSGDGNSKPVEIIRVGPRAGVVNIPVGENALELKLVRDLENGGQEFWTVKIDAHSGEVKPGQHGGEQASSLFNEQLQRFANNRASESDALMAALGN